MRKSFAAVATAAASMFAVVVLAAPANAAPPTCPPSQGQNFASHASIAACMDGRDVADLMKGGHGRG
jgi:hypothetical protein